jgi:hypothetical protein
MGNFERRNSSSIICPYCDAEYGDAWEKRQDEGTQVCEDCGKKFNWERRVDVDYITVADCLINNEEHDFKTTEFWVSSKDNPNEEFRILNCKKCVEYEVERRIKRC